MLPYSFFKKGSLILPLLFFCHFVNAQNGDSLRTADSTIYSISLGSTGIMNYTNESRSYLLNNLLKFNIIRKKFSVNTNNGYIYGSQKTLDQTILTNNDFFSTVDFNLLKSVQKLYYWGLANYDKSYSLKIENRLQTGIGLGYSLFNTPNINIILSDGILYERTSLSAPTDTIYSTIRNSFRLKYHIVIGKMITLDGTNFLQQSLFDKEDYIIKLSNSISFKIKTWLSFTVTSTYNKLNISGNENFMATAGLTFQKNFITINKE